ncbi:TadE/TadG family type IV pilus assembly protein [Nocardiopsis oceani]
MAGNSATQRDKGGASAELILVAPLLLAFLLLIAFVGRNFAAALAVDSLAHSAARAASVHQDLHHAQNAAEQAVAESVGGWGSACQNPRVTLDRTGTGAKASFRAAVTCTSERSEFGALGLDPTRQVTGTATSVMDTHREEAR